MSSVNKYFLLVAASVLISGQSIAVPVITGTPVIDSPKLINWERDQVPANPDLFEPTSNRIYDLHSQINDCDIVLSTSGNYHMALKELWYDQFLPTSPGLNNWMYTTSPPISVPQATNSVLTIGNWKTTCAPSVAVGPKGIMNSLTAAGLTDAAPIAVIQNYGNVLLVKKGNPKNIQNIWDLAKRNIKIVTPNPYTEPGSFGNYSGSIYNIAANDLNPPSSLSANKLFNAIFNANNGKWLAGARIHHREVPWSIAYGNADVGMIFYHLALYMKRNFPDLFDIVPLGGTVADPQPVVGNKVGTMFIVPLKGNWNVKQQDARTHLIDLYQSSQFTGTLAKHGLRRP